MSYPLPPGWTWEQWHAAWLAAIRTQDLPDLGAVQHTSRFVADYAGTGTHSATALRDYIVLTAYYAATGGTIGRTAPDHAGDILSVKDFGALGDGIADETAAFQAALNSNRSILVPAGTYRITNTLYFNASGQRLYGEGGGAWLTQIMWEGAGVDIFAMLGLQYCVLEGLHVRRSEALAPVVAGYAVRIGPSPGGTGAYHCEVRKCRFENLANGIAMQGSEHRVQDLDVYNLQGLRGVYFFGEAAIRSYRCVLDNVLMINVAGVGSALVDWITLDSYCYNMSLSKVQCGGARVGLIMKDTAASGTSYPIGLLATGLEIDGTNGDCVSLESGEGCQIVLGRFANSVSGNGIALLPGWRGDFSISGARVFGNYLHGVHLGAGFDAIFSNNLIGDNSRVGSGTAHGILVGANVGRFSITGNRIGDIVGASGNNQGYAVSIVPGTSDEYQIVGNVLPGNVTGRINDGGSGTNKFVQPV